MGSNLTIRAAQVDESQTMRQCGLRFLPNETDSIEHFEHILSTYPGLSHIAVNDKNETVGICLVRLREDVENAVHAHVSSILVIPEYQGQGIGRRLLTACLRSAKMSFNVSEVTLHVRKSNERAIGLYRSLKFYTVQTKPGHYYDGEDAFSMNLVLMDVVNT